MMENTNKYIAITIGPIGDTMELMAKPGALWLSSYMFSYICRRLCEKLIEKEFTTYENIVSPFIPDKSKEDEKKLYKLLMERKDGVGLFHDHIIFRYKEPKEGFEPWKEFSKIKDDVLCEVADKLFVISEKASDKEISIINDKKIAFKEYIMINACMFDYVNDNQNDGSVILHCGKMLDSLELPKVFRAVEDEHPIVACLENKEVKEIAKRFISFNNDYEEDKENILSEWNLVFQKKDSNDEPVVAFNSLGYISDNTKENYKKNSYYCILRADGDNMSKILGTLKSDESCRDFSKTCLEYCSEVAKRINSYGGMTLFAGGDDLLAIVPCEGRVFKRNQNYQSEYDYQSQKEVNEISTKHGTIFGLMDDINDIFENIFKNEINKIVEYNDKESKKDKKDQSLKPIPSLSFGAIICYKKYPLYEAMKRSGALLFDVAKNGNGEEKNCVAIQLVKHSGQSEELLIRKSSLKAFYLLLDEIIEKNKNGREEEIILSASQKVIMFKELFSSVEEEIKTKEDEKDNEEQKKIEVKKIISSIKNLFENIFDASEQDGKFLKEIVPEFYISEILSDGILLFENDKLVDNSAKTLGQALKMMKFFIEKGNPEKGGK